MNKKVNDKSVENGGDSKDAVVKVFGIFSNTHIDALGKTIAEHIGVLHITYIAAVFGMLIGGWLIYKDHEQLGGGVVVLAFVCMFAGMYFLRPAHKEDYANENAKSTEPPTWSRITLRPLSLQNRQHISDRLEGLLAQARADYGRIVTARTPPVNAKLENVRINVFLPDLSDVDLGEVCGLKILPELQHGMLDEHEKVVQFRPNEGLTGRVFTYGRACGARRDTELSGWLPVPFGGASIIGKDKFSLTEDQINQINKAIRWIVSFPLNGISGGTTHAYGVLNIDGLNEPLSAAEMTQLFHSLQSQVDLLARDFFKLDKCLITIDVRDAVQ